MESTATPESGQVTTMVSVLPTTGTSSSGENISLSPISMTVKTFSSPSSVMATLTVFKLCHGDSNLFFMYFC